MSDYQPALDRLRQRRKGRPGDLMLLTGVTAMIVVPAFLIGLRVGDEQNAQLARVGVVSEAVVKDKRVRTESGTNRKGRPSTTTIHSITVAYDFNAKTGYADWKDGAQIAKPAYPAPTTGEIEVGASYYDALAVGQTTTVVRDPADYKSLTLTDELAYETSLGYHLKWYLGLGAAFLAGLALTVLGWRKRKAHAAL